MQNLKKLKVVPRLFNYLWTIHGYIEQGFVPLIFCLMSRRRTDHYVKVLNQLPPLPKAQWVITDFELAEINAIKQVLPHAKVNLITSEGVES